MSRIALIIESKDNVATCTEDAQPGDTVLCHGTDPKKVVACERIPAWHKISLTNLPAGSLVYKYGEVIGKLTSDVPQGGLINDQNLVSIPRDYTSEYRLKHS